MSIASPPVLPPAPPPEGDLQSIAKRLRKLFGRARTLLRRASTIRTGKVDFEVAVVLRQEPPMARRVVYATSGLIVFAILWASLAEIDEVIRGEGRLVTTAQKMVVQPLETAVVRSIGVVPGDIVRAGQQLVTLDLTFSAADLAQTMHKHHSLITEIARLEAQMAGRAASEPGPAVSEEEMLQYSFQRDEEKEYLARLRALDEATGRARNRIGAARRTIETMRAQLGVLSEVEQMRDILYAGQKASKLSLLEARNARLDAERRLTASQQDLSDAEHDYQRGVAERDVYVQEWRRKHAEALVAARRERDQVVEQITKAERRRDLGVLVAPADAIVLEVAQRSVGSIVREAEPLITLVPLDVPLEAEVWVESRDIGFLAVGLGTRIKVEAFPFQKHGTLSGELRSISADSFVDEAGGGATVKPAASQVPRYRCRLTLTSTNFRGASGKSRLIPGMSVTAEILVGRRRVLSYFLYPILRTLDEGLREP